MPTNFPGAVDTFSNPNPSDPTTAPSHAAQHGNANDAIEAIETRVLAHGDVPTNGTFNPTIVGSTAAGVGTYSFRNGRWYRFGKLMYIEASIVWTAHTGTGNQRVGLPVNSLLTAGYSTMLGVISSAVYGSPEYAVVCDVSGPTALINQISTGAARAMAATGSMNFSGWYVVA